MAGFFRLKSSTSLALATARCLTLAAQLLPLSCAATKPRPSPSGASSRGTPERPDTPDPTGQAWTVDVKSGQEQDEGFRRVADVFRRAAQEEDDVDEDDDRTLADIFRNVQPHRKIALHGSIVKKELSEAAHPSSSSASSSSTCYKDSDEEEEEDHDQVQVDSNHDQKQVQDEDDHGRRSPTPPPTSLWLHGLRVDTSTSRSSRPPQGRPGVDGRDEDEDEDTPRADLQGADFNRTMAALQFSTTDAQQPLLDYVNKELVFAKRMIGERAFALGCTEEEERRDRATAKKLARFLSTAINSLRSDALQLRIHFRRSERLYLPSPAVLGVSRTNPENREKYDFHDGSAWLPVVSALAEKAELFVEKVVADTRVVERIQADVKKGMRSRGVEARYGVYSKMQEANFASWRKLKHSLQQSLDDLVNFFTEEAHWRALSTPGAATLLSPWLPDVVHEHVYDQGREELRCFSLVSAREAAADKDKCASRAQRSARLQRAVLMRARELSDGYTGMQLVHRVWSLTSALVALAEGAFSGRMGVGPRMRVRDDDASQNTSFAELKNKLVESLKACLTASKEELAAALAEIDLPGPGASNANGIPREVNLNLRAFEIEIDEQQGMPCRTKDVASRRNSVPRPERIFGADSGIWKKMVFEFHLASLEELGKLRSDARRVVEAFTPDHQKGGTSFCPTMMVPGKNWVGQRDYFREDCGLFYDWHETLKEEGRLAREDLQNATRRAFSFSRRALRQMGVGANRSNRLGSLAEDAAAEDAEDAVEVEEEQTPRPADGEALRFAEAELVRKDAVKGTNIKIGDVGDAEVVGDDELLALSRQIASRLRLHPGSAGTTRTPVTTTEPPAHRAQPDACAWW